MNPRLSSRYNGDRFIFSYDVQNPFQQKLDEFGMLESACLAISFLDGSSQHAIEINMVASVCSGIDLYKDTGWASIEEPFLMLLAWIDAYLPASTTTATVNSHYFDAASSVAPSRLLYSLIDSSFRPRTPLHTEQENCYWLDTALYG